MSYFDPQTLILSSNQLLEIRDNFLEQIQERDRKNSFLLTTIPSNSFADCFCSLKQDISQIFQVIIIGGTNFHVAYFELRKGLLREIIRFTKPTPKIANKSILIEIVRSSLEADKIPNLSHKVIIILTFSMQSVIRVRSSEDNKTCEILDGKILEGSKGHLLEGLIGIKIGQMLEQKISGNYQFMVTNDSIPLLAQITKNKRINSIAGVVGSGINLGFWSDNNTLIVLEPEKFKNYSEIAGAYLYKTFNQLRQEYNLSNWPVFSSTLSMTQAIEDINYSLEIRQTIINLIQRSAMLFSSSVAALIDYKNYKKNRKIDLIMEGSLFWHGYKYQEYFWQGLDILAINRDLIDLKKNTDPIYATALLFLLRRQILTK
jgi:hexokinase